MNGPSSESVELFLQEASENLQYLREYSGILQEPQTRPDDLEKLYIAAHTLAGTSASYGFPQFSEVGAKMAHIFHYAMHATLTPDMHGPLTEFISDAISVLEFDLLQISTNGEETTGDIAAFKQRYSFAFPAAPASESRTSEQAARAEASEPPTNRLLIPTSTVCRKTRKWVTRSWNSSSRKRRNIYKPSPNVYSLWREVRTPKRLIACSGRCTPLKVRRRKLDCTGCRRWRIASRI